MAWELGWSWLGKLVGQGRSESDQGSRESDPRNNAHDDNESETHAQQPDASRRGKVFGFYARLDSLGTTETQPTSLRASGRAGGSSGSSSSTTGGKSKTPGQCKQPAVSKMKTAGEPKISAGETLSEFNMEVLTKQDLWSEVQHAMASQHAVEFGHDAYKGQWVTLQNHWACFFDGLVSCEDQYSDELCVDQNCRNTEASPKAAQLQASCHRLHRSLLKNSYKSLRESPVGLLSFLRCLAGFIKGSHVATTYTLYYRALQHHIGTHWKFAIEQYPATETQYTFVQGTLKFAAGKEGHDDFYAKCSSLVANWSVSTLAQKGLHCKTEKHPLTAFHVKKLLLETTKQCQWTELTRCSAELQAVLLARGWPCAVFPLNVRGVRLVLP